MRTTPQDIRKRPRPTTAPTRKERAARQIILCAVRDDDHLQDVVATGRALERTGSFQVRFVHVAAPAVRLRVPVGFAAGDASPAGTLPLGSSLGELAEHARDAGLALLERAGIDANQAIVLVGEACRRDQPRGRHSRRCAHRRRQPPAGSFHHCTQRQRVARIGAQRSMSGADRPQQGAALRWGSRRLRHRHHRGMSV